MNAALGCVTGHGAQISMHQRLTANKKQIANMVFDADIDHVPGLGQRNASALPGIKPVYREPAEVALGVPDVRNSELEIAWPAMVQHIGDQFSNAAPGSSDGRQFL